MLISTPYRFRAVVNGGRGLSGYWEEYQYLDAIAAGTPSTTSPSSDAGSSWMGSVLNTVAQLGTTYIQSEAAKDAAKIVAQSRPAAGQTTVVSPTGQLMTTQAPAPVSSSAMSWDFLKNPLVLAGIGVGAFLLLRRKK